MDETDLRGKLPRQRHGRVKHVAAFSLQVESAQNVLVRLGNLWVTGGSALSLIEEAVELPAGGIEGALLVFPAIVYQGAAVLVDHIADHLFRGDLSQRRLFVQVADDLSA